MIVKLECIKDVNFKMSLYYDEYKEVKVGDIVDAEFSQFGVKFFIDNVWTLHFSYEVAKLNFKVLGQ